MERSNEAVAVRCQASVVAANGLRGGGMEAEMDSAGSGSGRGDPGDARGRRCAHAHGLKARRSRWMSGVLVGLTLGMTASALHADFVAPATWSRGQVSTTYQEWDRFTVPAGPNAPDVGVFNPNGTPSVADASGMSLVTGSGNIYSPTAALHIDVFVPDYATPGAVATVILQTRTIGTELDAATLNVGGLAPVDQGELLRAPFGGPGGFVVENWFKFHLPTSGPSFTVEFAALGSSMSLDRLAVDSITAGDYLPEPNPVPEPVSVLLLASGGTWLAVRRKHRNCCCGSPQRQ